MKQINRFYQVQFKQIGAAIIGPTVKGPALVPTQIRTFAEFQSIFGSYTDESYVPFTVQEYLRNGQVNYSNTFIV
jgi:hypothetical protein